MSKTAYYSVVYNDESQHDFSITNDTQGIVRDIFEQYLATADPSDHPVTFIEKMEDLARLSAIAARLMPIHLTANEGYVLGFNNAPEFNLDSEATQADQVDMIMPTCRIARFAHFDINMTERYYIRYVKLFNEGKALFGAQLKNIERISIELY